MIKPSDALIYEGLVDLYEFLLASFPDKFKLETLLHTFKFDIQKFRVESIAGLNYLLRHGIKLDYSYYVKSINRKMDLLYFTWLASKNCPIPPSFELYLSLASVYLPPRVREILGRIGIDPGPEGTAVTSNSEPNSKAIDDGKKDKKDKESKESKKSE